MESLFCKCGNRRRPGGRYCLACHAAAQRQRRQRVPLTKAERRKANVRRSALHTRKTGKLAALPCEVCGAKEVEMHIPNFSIKPPQVVWLCRRHRLSLLATEKSE